MRTRSRDRDSFIFSVSGDNPTSSSEGLHHHRPLSSTMDLRSIINTENASNPPPPPSSPPNNPPPAHGRPSFPPPATPYTSSAYSATAPYSQPQQQQQHNRQSIDALTSPSPYTPQSSNAGFQQQPQQKQPSFPPQRSQSIQSVLSSDPPASYQYNPRDHSPVAASQPLPSQHFSPRAQGSLPGTPLGPPPASFTRNSPPSSSVRPHSSDHESQSNQPSSPWTRPDSHGHDQKPFISPTTQSRHVRQDSRPVEQTPRQRSTVSEQEREESVSPKTTGTPGTRHENSAGIQDQGVPQYARNPSHSEERAWKESPTRSESYSSQQPIGRDAHRPPPTRSISIEDKNQALPSKMDTTPDVTTSSSPHYPKRKRRRYNEPPIFAQRCNRTRGTVPVIPNKLPPIPKHARDSPSNPWAARIRSSIANAPAAPARANSQAPSKNHADETTPVNGPPAHPHAPQPPQLGLLGPWEPSITGYIPHEDVTKMVCDFLFQHVVLRNDASAGPAGSSAVGQGAIVEVEAKLGQHIDLDRGDRVFLPIMTESILNRDNPRFRTSFNSSMSLAQHRAMNNFLNEAVKASMPNSNPGRIPLSYAHKKERDTFYEVSPSELPPIIRQNLNPRHKPRVRVTTDQRNGDVLAKIVKCRVADLDVLSPRTCVDFRISVNLEMNYEGDVSQLTVVDSATGGGKARDRNKDRMSYRHLAYQVDLTQVAKSESVKNEFDHELEIEVSAAEIRNQGQLAMAGDPGNQYEDLIKGFVDNIRVLARAVPP